MAILPLQLARVSNLLRQNTSTSAISRTQQRLLEVQNQLVTGNRLNAPSDDPGDSAVTMQLQKLLEQREAYADNLGHATSQLAEVDSTLGDLTDLLNQAQQIASANVGSDVTADERLGAAAVIKSITSQALSLANKQFEGVFLFAGDKSTDPPFVEDVGGVKFVGNSNVLRNVYDENTRLPFMVDGAQVFGAMSTRVQGSVDLAPVLAGGTRVADLAGATGDGVRLGSIQLSNGSVSQTVDLSGADSVQDVINAINDAAVGGITAAVAPDNNSLILTAAGGDDITVTEIAGGTTAADLGLLRLTPSGAGVALDGAGVGAKVTNLTPLASLNAGAGIDTAGLVLTNGTQTVTVDLSAATTVEDLLNAINGSKAGVRAQINAAGDGIDLVNPTQGVAMTVGENGGTTAFDLGIRSLTPLTPLAELNNGKGVGVSTGTDMEVVRRDGTRFEVDFGAAATIQDVIDAINTADAGGGLTASFATTGNGIVLTDSTGGAGQLTVGSLNFSTVVKDLGLDAAVSGSTLAGRDTNAVEVAGVFANLRKLTAALETSDQGQITKAAEGLKSDYDRVVRTRGETGARVQELEARQNRLDDENVATKGLLSKLKDADFTQAISEFTTMQTALQASLQTTAKVMNLSLMDFLG
ncbi:MAG TPA: flagellin hook IN motif-containing protein [Tepidisphaeraceae bacterium]|nr:flagellin hook IN motif-containing protein [Tepidisphaeraceae bacterium]